MTEPSHLTLSVKPARRPDQATEWKIVITRKTIGLATGRNRWKRRIREVLRGVWGLIRPGHEAILKVVSRSGEEPSYRALQKEIICLLTQSGLLENQEER